MKEQLNQVTHNLVNKAEVILSKNKNPQAIMSSVLAQGGKALLTKNLSLVQAEELTAMMIAAISLVRYQQTPQDQIK